MFYKAVIFDLFGTLIENMDSEDYRTVLENMAGTLTPDREQFVELWLKYTDERMTGSHTNIDSMNTVLQQMDLSPDPAVIENALSLLDPPVADRLVLREQVAETVKKLQEKGYLVGIASNCSWEVPLLWEASPWQQLIPQPVFSCSAGVQKPDPEIYYLAAEAHELEPDDCLFVDDSIVSLIGAAEVGMVPVHIQDDEVKSYNNKGARWGGNNIKALPEIIDLIELLNS